MKLNFSDEEQFLFQLTHQIDKAYVCHQVIRFLCKHGYIEPLEGGVDDQCKKYRFRVLKEFRVGDYLYVIKDKDLFSSIRSMRSLEHRIQRLK